jgi:hypothetical protein
MTETPSADVITQALALIDDGLGTLLHRELISSSEVTDLLLDVRTLLSTPSSPSPESVDAAPVPVG